MSRTPLFSLRAVCAGAALMLLAACASTPEAHFYTLNSGAAAAPATVRYYVEVQAVGVPQQVSRTQFVVGSGDGRIELLEQERWAGPLSGEIGQALSLDVTSELGAIDVFRSAHPDNLPVYRISTNVQRFESVPGQHALIDAVWSVRQLTGGAVLTCRSVFSEPVGPGYDALVAGHRRAVAKVAAAMVKVVRSMADGGVAGC